MTTSVEIDRGNRLSIAYRERSKELDRPLNPAEKKEIRDRVDAELAAEGKVGGNGFDTNQLLCLSEVITKPVSFLSYPTEPLGKLISAIGEPGEGKSTIYLRKAADLSRGRAYPGREAGEPKVTLLASAEDGLADTIRPRLEAMDADLTKIHAITGALDFTDDGIDILDGYIAQILPDLVVIDPIMAYIGTRIDVYRPNVVRVIQAQLADVAENRGCAIVSIRHLSKAQVRRPIHAGLGSIDFSAACRSVLLIGSDPDNPSKRAIVHIKSNLAPRGDTIGFELVNGGLNWTGKSDLTAERILGIGYKKDLRQQDADNRALDVVSILGEADVNAVVKELGLNRVTVQNRLHALREAGLLTCKVDGKRIIYSLPSKEPVASKNVVLQNTSNDNTLQHTTVTTDNNNTLQDKHVGDVMCSTKKSKATHSKEVVSIPKVETKEIASDIKMVGGFKEILGQQDKYPCVKGDGFCRIQSKYTKQPFACGYTHGKSCPHWSKA